MPKKTPAQSFKALFDMAMAGEEKERIEAEKKVRAWLKRNGKKPIDVSSILAQAVADDAADEAAKQPPPPDPRGGAPHPYNDPRFTPVDLVYDIIGQYVMMNEHGRVIVALWAVFTHVYPQFMIAPRILLVSEDPHSGKSTLRKVLKHLVFRPNRETISKGPAIERFIARGPCTIMLDETDYLDADAKKAMLKIWNVGHDRDAEDSMVIGGQQVYFSLFAPMLLAGIGRFMDGSPLTRAFVIEMSPCDESNKPERNYNEDPQVADLDGVYSYVCNWVLTAKLNVKPKTPRGMINRFADNARGLLAVADACGPEEWGRRAREAVAWMQEQERAVHPKVLILQHTLLIIDMLELDPIPSHTVNRELLRLDLPEARWHRFRGAGGGEHAHPLTLDEQARLLRLSGIKSKLLRPSGGGKPFRGYRREWFVEALRQHDATSEPPSSPRPPLRLITPRPE
jgi:hypothetical protein